MIRFIILVILPSKKLVKHISHLGAIDPKVGGAWLLRRYASRQLHFVNCFKNQLDKLRTKQMDFFMDEYPLNPLAAEKKR